MASHDFFGLSVASGDGGPAIIVNIWERIPVERWIFSAAHELGHLLLHRRYYHDLARDNGWICITNDKPLRRKCEEHQTRVLWGLETLALLVEGQAIPPEDAGKIAFRIHQANSMYITRRIYEDFCRRIGV